MSSVDDRIVNMQFNNKQFQTGVTESQKSLSGLEQSLQNTAKSKGLEGLASSVQGVSGKFSAMKIAGVTAIATIANKAVNAGIGLVKSLTIDPLLQGWQEYNTNLTSIQTVMANTGKGIKPVQDALNQLNHYSDQTIYNFSQMAHNVGTFTAAGVKLKTSVAAIQGISNIAALSGSSAEQASTAMYQLSQAIAAGRVNLQDWNSVVNAGMGGKNLQRALIQTGEAMGKLSSKSVQLNGNIKIAGASFRESISAKGGKSWLSSDVLVKTLSLMDGRLSKTAITAGIMAKGQHTLAEATVMADTQLKKQQETLKKQGFNKEQIKNLTSMANRAYESATVVKTLPQLMGVVQESIGSVWSTAFSGIVGNFQQSKKVWTAASNSIGNVTKAINNHMTDMIVHFNRAGGRAMMIFALKTAFKSLGSIIATIAKAFHDVFPADGGKGLASVVTGFRDLMIQLTPQPALLASLRNIFGGIFAVLHIGFTIVSALAAGFGAFFGALTAGTGGASGGVLKFIGHIGELLKDLDKFLTSGGKMKDLFTTIGSAAGGLAGQGIGALKNWIAGLVGQLEGSSGGLLAKAKGIGQNIVDGLSQGMSSGAIGKLKAIVSTLANYIPDTIKNLLGIHSPSTVTKEIGGNIIQGLVDGLANGVHFIVASIGQLVGAVLGGLKDGFGNMDALDFASILNAVLTGALILTMQRFVSNASKFLQGFTTLFSGLETSLKNFQNALKAEALLAIALAVGALVAAVVLISLVPADKLKVAIGAIGILMVELVAAMQAMKLIAKGKNKETMTSLAASFFIIASAMTVLAGAVALFGNMDMETLKRGISGMAISLGIMVGAVAATSKMGPVALRSSAAFIAFATAMNIMAGAVALFGHMDVKTLIKGIGAMGFVIGQMTISLAIIGSLGPSTFGAAAAIMAMALAMNVMAGAVALFGNMDPKTLVVGIAALGFVLAQMAISLAVVGVLGPAGLAAAASILALAGAMVVLLPFIVTLGNMDWETFAKGLLGLGIALGLFVIAIAALGAVGAVVGPGLLVVGAALALIGLGMLAFGTGFAIMAAAGTAGIAVMSAAISAFILLLPSIATQIAAAFVVFIQVIAAASPKLRKAFGEILKNIIGVVTDAVPHLGALFQKIITTAINIIKKSVPQFVEAGFTIIDRFLKSAAKHAPSIVDSATKLIITFLDAIGNNLPKIADKGAKMIIKFINGMADAINNNVVALRNAGIHMAGALINGMTGGLAGEGMAAVKRAAQAIANALPGWMKKVLHIKSPSRVTHEIGMQAGRGFANGIDASVSLAVAAAVRMANAVISGTSRSVAQAQSWARAQQKIADDAQAQADLAKQRAQRVNAKKSPKLAKALKKKADSAQAAADAAQNAADNAAQGVQNAKDWEALDLHGKGDAMVGRAEDQAKLAARLLAKANAEAAEAAKLQKTNRKAAAAMLAQARKDAQAAKAWADQSLASNAQANAYYAQEVNARIAQLEADRKAEADAKKAQAEYDAADQQGKIDILNKRAEAAQAKADAANAAALALIDQAKALANSDAAGAMALLDQAEQQAQAAKDAADAAQQAKDQIDQLTGQGASGGTGGDTPGSPIQPSKSILEDAARVVDRYTASLAEAELAAAATQQPVQFIQNNTSPVALTPSEVYRQTNNLLSAAEIKMGAK